MKRKEPYDTEISKHQYPAEEGGPGEQEVKKEEDGEDETGLPCVKPRLKHKKH